jgi:transposase
MSRLKITHFHGFTAKSLRKEERKIKDAFLKQRVTAVRLVMEGYCATDVAHMANLCRQSVSTYVKTFENGGLVELLKRDFPPGKEPILSIERQKELKRTILESTPAQEEIEISASWDSRLIQLFLRKKWGIRMSRSGIMKMLRRMNLRFTRPTYTLARADKHKLELFLTQLDVIKKTLG